MKKSEIDFLLLAKVVLVSMAYFYLMLFLSNLFCFLYFGSGAGASSNFAILVSYILFYFCVLSPMIFILYKTYSYRKTNQLIKFNSYLVSSILITLLMIYQFFQYN
jgi:hypothetical protein